MAELSDSLLKHLSDAIEMAKGNTRATRRAALVEARATAERLLLDLAKDAGIKFRRGTKAQVVADRLKDEGVIDDYRIGVKLQGVREIGNEAAHPDFSPTNQQVTESLIALRESIAWYAKRIGATNASKADVAEPDGTSSPDRADEAERLRAIERARQEQLQRDANRRKREQEDEQRRRAEEEQRRRTAAFWRWVRLAAVLIVALWVGKAIWERFEIGPQNSDEFEHVPSVQPDLAAQAESISSLAEVSCRSQNAIAATIAPGQSVLMPTEDGRSYDFTPYTSAGTISACDANYPSRCASGGRGLSGNLDGLIITNISSSPVEFRCWYFVPSAALRQESLRREPTETAETYRPPARVTPPERSVQRAAPVRTAPAASRVCRSENGEVMCRNPETLVWERQASSGPSSQPPDNRASCILPSGTAVDLSYRDCRAQGGSFNG